MAIMPIQAHAEHAILPAEAVLAQQRAHHVLMDRIMFQTFAKYAHQIVLYVKHRQLVTLALKIIMYKMASV